MYKQFASDVNQAQIVSIEPYGIPPANPLNTMVPAVIDEDNGFIINGERTPLFKPPLYIQQVQSNANASALQNSSYLQQYTFAQGQVVDW